jgi:hypothetical protein
LIARSAAARSATWVISNPPGIAWSRPPFTCAAAWAGPATAIGRSRGSDRAAGQANAISTTVSIAVSKVTTTATGTRRVCSATALSSDISGQLLVKNRMIVLY